MSLATRRRAIYTGLAGHFAEDELLAVLALWESKYADKPPFALNEFLGEVAATTERKLERAKLYRELLAPLHDASTAACVIAERALARRLNGSCQVPLAAYGEDDDGFLRLRALIARPDGSDLVRAEASGSLASAEALGLKVAELLLIEGAGSILHELAHEH